MDWKAILGIAITLVLLWYVLRDVDFTEVWVQVRQGDMVLLAAGVAVATFGFLIRAVRWKILLVPLKSDTGLRSRFAAVSIGFMANNLLPARIGEFARAYAFSRVEPVSVSGTFGTLVVERVLDGLVLLGLLLLAVSWPTFPGAQVLEEGRMGRALDGIVVVLGLLILGLVVLMLKPRPFVRAAGKMAALLPGDFARPVVDALEAFLESLVILRRPVLLLKAFAWSVAFWLWHGVSFYLGMLAFGIRPADPYIAALFTSSVVGFGVAIPSAPGFIGTFHAAADWALSGVYGVEPARSLAFAFGYHFGGWIPITLIGLYFAWRLGLSLGDVQRSEERVEKAVEARHPVAARLLAAREAQGTLPGPVQNPEPVAAGVAIEAPAKVNLALRVLAPEEGTGYHQIETLFQAVGLVDRLRIEVIETGVDLRVEGVELGPPRENLVWKAASAFAAETGLARGLRIHLEKRIPPGAGLGGGSSDAASTLLALNELFGSPVARERLREIAARIGSDVPFFLAGSTLALAWGRGERLLSLPPLPEVAVVLVVPSTRIATGAAYAALDRHRGDRWGTHGSGTALVQTLDEGDALEWEGVEALATNDFEDVILPAYPEVAELHAALWETRPRFTLLSGSGSAVFAVYHDEARADEVALELRRRGGGAQVHRVPTLTRMPGPRLSG